MRALQSSFRFHSAKGSLILLAGVILTITILSIIPGPPSTHYFQRTPTSAPSSTVSTFSFVNGTSWNPKVSCKPWIVTIEDVVGNQVGPTGGAAINGSIFDPGIFVPHSLMGFTNDSAKRWLTPGPTPVKWVPSGPQCYITNVKGQMVAAFVQINGIRRDAKAEEDLSSSFDAINANTTTPTPYPNGVQSDTTFNIYNPSASSTTCTGPGDSGCMHRIHLEIDHDWKGASYCGPFTTCDNNTLFSQTSAGITPMDVQGFVFWDPDHTSDPAHNLSGWELHPLTGWRISNTSPLFALSASPNNVNMLPGKSANSTISVSSFNLFSGSVSFTYAVLPSPSSIGPFPNATFTPGTVTVPPDGTGSSRMTINTSSSTSGTYIITVSGRNGTCGAGCLRQVNVTTLVAGFTMSSNPASLSVPSGSSRTSIITLTSVGGFNGTISLAKTASGCGCIIATLNSTSVMLLAGGTKMVTLNVTAVSEANNATITLTGTSQTSGFSTFTTVTVNVFDFSITTSRISLRMNAGSTNSTSVNLASLNGFSGVVMLTRASNSTSLASTLSASSVTLQATGTGSTGSVLLTVNGTVAGNYIVTINATSGSLIHRTTISISVVDFSLASVPFIQVNVGSTTSATINLASLNGFSGIVSLTNSTSSSALHDALSTQSVTLTSGSTGFSNLSVYSLSVNNYTLTITATSGSLHYTVLIKVNVVDFSIAAGPVTPSAINVGSSGNSTITITGVNGFTKNVALTVSASTPSGLTCTLTPTSVSLPPSPFTSLLSCSASAARDYTVTVTGVNGGLSHTTGAITFHVVDFIVIPSKSSLTLTAGSGTGTDSISLASSNGFTGAITLSVSISPLGPSAQFTETVVKLTSIGNSTTMTINPGQVAGTFKLNVTGTFGSLTHSVIVTLFVTPAKVSITTTLSSASITAGASVNDSASLSGTTTSAGGSVIYTLFRDGVCRAPGAIVSTVAVVNGVVPNSRSVVLNATGSYSFNATYSGDNSNSAASSSCEPLAVQKDSPTIATSLSLTSIQVGQSVTDSATLSSFFQAGGTVSYNLFVGSSSCAGGSSPVSNVTVTNGVIPSSRIVTFNSTNPGGYGFQAVYSGDANNKGATSGCELLSVNPVGVSITTTLSATTIPVGGTVSDNSTLHGQTSTAGGSVTYSYFANSNCAAPATVVSIASVSNGVVPNSRAVTLNSSGTFSFNAIYSGDSNNNGATSVCEPLTVNKVVPTIATVINPSSIITIGSSVTDQATLAGGFPSIGVTGTVTYTLFSFTTLPSAAAPCSGGTIIGTSQTVIVGAGNSVPVSSAVTPPSPGFFGFSAVYNGNGNNTVATGNCEPLTVNKQTPTLTTTISPSSSVVAGTPVTDQATITGGYPSTGVGGTVTYRFFGLGNGICTGTPVAIQMVSVGAGNAVPPSNSQTPTSPGQYSYNPTYSGDQNNNQVTSSCELMTVNLISTTTGITCGSSVTVNVPTSCTVTVSDTAPGTITPTGVVNISTNATGTFAPPSPCSLSGSTSSASCSFTYTPGVLGAHNITATYTGDNNHRSSSGSTLLSPGKHSTTINVSCTSPILTNQASTCTANLTDTSTVGATTPSGSVAFTETGITGSFNVTSCTLVGTGSTASCGVKFTPSTPGTANVVGSYAGDSTHNPSSNSASPTQITVNPSLIVVNPSATPAAIDTGQSVSLSASFGGGTAPYICRWLQKAPGASAYTGLGGSSSCTSPVTTSSGILATIGSWSFEFQVNESSSSPVSVTSGAVAVNVNPALSPPTISVSPSAVDLGQSATLTTVTSFSGGTAPFVCQWLAKAPGGASYTNLGNSFSCNATDKPTAPTGVLSTAGSWSFELRVTDNGSPSELVNSTAVSTTVNPSLIAPAISANPTVINAGQTATLSTTTSFSAGTPTYVCQWLQRAQGASAYSNLGAPFACNAGDKPTVSTGALSTTGSWSFELQVSDSGSPSEIVASNIVTVTVNGVLSAGPISPNAPAIDAGQSITLTSNPSGGTVPYSYQWYSDGVCTNAIASATSSTFNSSPSVTSTYSVKVTDSASSFQCSTGDTVTVNPALVAGAVTPSAPTIDVGQSVTLGANSSGGSAPYHYQWFSGGSAVCSSDGTLLGTTSTQVVSPTTNMYYCYTATDSAFAPASQSSATDLVTVDLSLVAGSITPSGPAIDSGQSVILSSNPSGGTTPYSYQWYSAPSCSSASLISGATFSTYAASPASTTTYSYKVTDSSQGSPSASQCSPGDLVTVNPALTVGAITPTSPKIDGGQSITLSSHASGGTPSLSYQWFSDGACTTIISGATLSTYSASPTSATTYSYKVTDSAFSPISQCSSGDAVSVNPALVAGLITPTSPAINGGQTITLTANPSGGTVLYSYQWYSDGTCNIPISSATSSTFSATPTVTTTYSYKVTDAAFSPVSKCSPGDAVTVNSAIAAGAITPANPAIDNGQSVTLASHVSGGTPPFSYQWYSDGVCSSAISGALSSTFTGSPASTTSYSYKVTDSAQTPVSACSPADAVTVNPTLTAGAATPSAPTIDAGQSITLTSHALGGTVALTYRWYSDGICSLPITGATSATYLTTPSVTTTYAYLVTDNAYSPVSQCSPSDTITVNPVLVANAITPQAPTVDSGQSITLSANPSGGTTPYSYQWYSAANCPTPSLISGATSSTYSAQPASTTTYSYKATDSSQGNPIASSCSPGDPVTVNAALSAVPASPNAPAIDTGQSISLSANPSGGTTPYSYQWYVDGACANPIPGATSSVYPASPTVTSTYSYKVTDSVSSSQCSPGDIVTVNPAIVAGAITPSSPIIDNGQSITLASAPSGGTTPYSYQWFSTGSCTNPIPGATLASYTVSPTSATAYSYRVTDSAFSSVARCSPDDIVTVNSALVAGAIAPSSPTIDTGQSITLSSNPSGGTSPYSFQWYSGASTSCALDTTVLGTSAAQSVSPAANTYYCYVVVDSAFTHASRSSAVDLVTVSSVLVPGAITPSSPTIDSGQSVILTANPSGGTGPYSYQWYSGTSPSCSADTAPLGTLPTQTVSSTSSAYYCYRVTDSSTGFPAAASTSPTDLVTVNPALAVSSITAASPIDSGQSTSVVISWSGGTSPYIVAVYTSTSPSSCTGLVKAGQNNGVTGTTTSFTQSPTATTNYCASITDGASTPVLVQSTTPSMVVVNPALSVNAPTATPSVFDSGQQSTLSATFAGGTSPYTCQWLEKGPGATTFTALGSPSACTSPASASTGVLTTSGSWSFEIQVSDTGSPSVTLTSNSILVTVNPPTIPPVIVANPTTIGSGQFSTLSTTTSFNGGTSPETCQWLRKGPLDASFGNLGASFACVAGDKPTVPTGALSTSGVWSFELQVRDSGSPSQVVTSSQASVTVNGALSAGAIAPSAPAIDAGQSITLTASGGGGVPPYSFQWYSDATCTNLISSATASTYATNPATTTTYSYKVIDSNAGSQCSPGDTVIVSPALVASPITPAAPTIDTGQSITLASNPSGGTAPYSYQWFTDGSCSAPVGGAISSTLTVSPGATQTYAYKLSDSSQGTPASSQCSAGDTVTVNPALEAAAITPSNPTIDTGQSITLSSHVSGGTSPISYQWYSDPTCGTPIAGAIASTYIATPTSTSTYSYKATDSASSSASQCSVGNTVTVAPALVAGTISPATPSIDNGQSITLTAHPAGGAISYTYQWHSGLSATCASDAITLGTAATQTVSPTANTYYCYTVTDATSSAQSSPTDLVSVNPSLVAGSVTPPSPSIDSGQSIILTANPSGGIAPYHYQWYSSTNAACPSASSIAATATLLTSPATSTYYCYTVSDSSAGSPAVSVTSAGTLVTVNLVLGVGQITPSSPAIDSGQPIALTANPSGGTTPYQYQWYSGPSPTCSSDNTLLGIGSTQTVAPTLSTYYCYRVNDSSIGSPSAGATSVTDLVAVSPALAAGAIAPSSPSIDNGQSIVLTAKPSAGVGAYSYQWYLDGSCTAIIPGATSSTYTALPSVSASYSYKVTDSAYVASTACSPGDVITVNSALAAGAITPSSPAIDNGQSITLTGHATGGTSPLSYQWYFDGACTSAIPGATSSTYLFQSPSTTTLSYRVTDSSQGTPAGTMCSAGDTVTVNSLLTAGPITPQSQTINNGQTITLASGASGGTAPYSYQWYSSLGCPSGSLISGATSSTYSAQPASTTTYSYKVADSSQGSPATSPCSSGDTVKVNPTLAARSITPLNPTIDTGQQIVLKSQASGGTQPFSYQWYSDASCATAIAGAIQQTYSASPTATISYSYRVTDSANVPVSLCSPGDTVTVNNQLAAGSTTPAFPAIDNGQSITLTANPSGGTGPYGYVWYSSTSAACPAGPALGTTATLLATPTADSYYCYSVTDSSVGAPSSTAISGFDLVTVSPALTINTPSSSAAVDSGQYSTVSATFSGGVAPYACQWLAKSPAGSYNPLGGSAPCASSATISTGTLALVGAWSFELQVTDSASTAVTIASPATTITVNPQLSPPTISVSPTTQDLGLQASLATTVSFSGGTPPYACQWLEEAPGAGSHSNLGSSFPCNAGDRPTAPTGSLSTAGSWSFELKVTDSGSPSQTVTPNVTLTIRKASPTVATTLSSSTIVVGDSVTDSATIMGSYQAAGSVTYQFYSGSTCTGTSTTVGSSVAVTGGSVPKSASQEFGAAGAYSWSASYSGDANNNPAVGSCQTLTAFAPPTLTVPGPQSVTAGSKVHFVINATGAGGCNAVTLALSGGLPSGATFTSAQCFAGSASSVFSWTPTDSQAPGDYKVTFTATDAHGAVTSSQVTIHVSSVNKAPSLPILSYSVFGIVGFSAVVLAALGLRRIQTAKRKP